ncbi:MAG: glycosyltransferase family 2 protein [Saprospiraceae bacterium]
MIIDVIIPAYNEQDAIGKVIDEIPKYHVRNIIVCNNNSTDNTTEVAKTHGAIVLLEKKKGYGNACLKGIEYLKSLASSPDIVVFIDGDHSDYPEFLPELVGPILSGKSDMVIGSRVLGISEKGSMTIPQRFGNWLATRMILWIYHYTFTDLGPFRAIRYESLIALDMQDKTFGWTAEMQIKAAKQNLRCIELPVNYRQRIGVSKVSGTVKGTILAGYKIIWTILKLI